MTLMAFGVSMTGDGGVGMVVAVMVLMVGFWSWFFIMVVFLMIFGGLPGWVLRMWRSRLSLRRKPTPHMPQLYAFTSVKTGKSEENI